MSKNSDSEKGIIVLGMIIGGIFVIYFISLILSMLGKIAIFAGIVAFIFGVATKNIEIGGFGVAIFFAGLLFTSIGTVGLNFFEENPTGKTLLDSSTAVVDTSTKAYIQTSEAKAEVRKAVIDATKELNQVNGR